MDTLTKSKIIDNLFTTVGLSKNESSKILEFLIFQIIGSLKNGEDVKIANFGTFKLKDKNSRVGRNPKTMKEYKISARRVVRFKPSNLLIKKLNRQ